MTGRMHPSDPLASDAYRSGRACLLRGGKYEEGCRSVTRRHRASIFTLVASMRADAFARASAGLRESRASLCLCLSFVEFKRP